MMSPPRQRGISLRGETGKFSRAILRSVEGAQLVEFAFVLPLLLVMVVGIIDFGAAYTLKHKMNNAAREGARFSIEESCADCTKAAPATTQAIENSIVNYLTNANVDLCGLTGTTAPTTGPGTFAWTFTSPSQCAGTGANFTIVIERGITFLNSSGVTVEASRVTLSHPYAWTFGKIIGFLVSGAGSSYPGVLTISSDATMQNLPGS